jgi:muramoyltetrapeptide carboxypeptidase
MLNPLNKKSLTLPWVPLKEGDTVDIVAPGSIQFQEDIEAAKKYLETLHLVPRVHPDIFGPALLYANTNEKRFEVLKEALYAKDSKAVWCIRGGYGSTRLIPKLLELAPPLQPKIFIGFSDITSLHIFLNQQWNWIPLHGPVLRQLTNKTVDNESIQLILDIIFGRKRTLTYNLHPMNLAALKDNLSLQSTLTGGNMSIIQTSLGGSWHIQTKGKVLFFEEVNERAYRTAERLEHLRQAKVFQGIDALVFSTFSWDQENKVEADLTEKVLKTFADECSFPVFSSLGIGHGPRNLTMPVGAKCQIIFNRQVSELLVDLMVSEV